MHKKSRWEGIFVKPEKGERVAAGCQGVGKEKTEGNPRVWRLGGLGQGLGYSRVSKHFYFLLQNNFGKIIFEKGDDCLGKTFSTNFRKIK